MELLFSTMKMSPDKEFGHIDFSYGVVAKNFERSLVLAGNSLKFVPRPEFLPVQKSRKIHLMMRKFRSFRPVSGAYNIAVISWEFNQLQSDSTQFEGLFYDQVGMLQMADEIWVASSHLKSVFESYGLSNVHFIPCPIGSPYFEADNNLLYDKRAGKKKLGKLGFLNSICFSSVEVSTESIKPLFYAFDYLENAKVYLTVFNPHDHRKNIEKLILSFYAFSQHHPDAYLIIKCNTELKVLTSVLKLVAKKVNTSQTIASSNILILNEKLSESELAMLYEFSDFYFCLSHGEGQNLPLQESMARGCVPVSVSNTAMSDCVNTETSFEIRSSEKLIHIADRVCFHNINKLSWYDVDIADVVSALCDSYEADKDELRLKAGYCLDVISQQYSDQAVAEFVMERLSKINE